MILLLVLLQSSGSTGEAGGPHSHICRLVLPVGWVWSPILIKAGPGFLMWYSQGSKSLREEAERPLEAKVLKSYDVPSSAFYCLRQVIRPAYIQGDRK